MSSSLHRRRFYLNLITISSTPRQLDQILAHAVLSGHHPDLPTATRLAARFADIGSISSAHRLALSVPCPDLFLLNTLIRSYSRLCQPAAALSLFSSLPLRDPPLFPDAFTFSFAVSAASSLGFSRHGRALHALSIAMGFQTDPFVGSALVDLYLGFSDIYYAEKMFDEIPFPDSVAWNALISGLTKNDALDKSLKAFTRMMAIGTSIDPTTVAVILPVVAELQDLSSGSTLHCLSVKVGVSSHPFVLTGLISMYSKCCDISAAKSLFDEILNPDLVARNAMISGYSSNGHVNLSVGLFREFLALGGKVNSSTMVGLIPVFDPFGHEALTQTIHGFSIKSGVHLNSPVSTAITTVYSRLNELDEARKLFDEMPEKSLASWNAMISGYTQNGSTEVAISLFEEMQKLDIRPNTVTVTSILSACAQLGTLGLGKWVHRMIKEQGLVTNVFVLTALIDMFAKCGALKEARREFDGMSDRNIVTWNAMIAGYGLHGHGREALDLFSDMQKAQIIPNRLTFLSVLYACSHGGLVEDGRAAFHAMSSKHNLTPGPEHYACVVDLLGRSGRLQEALEFVETSPADTGPGVWGALLGACMKHKETELAQLASQKLFELDPENTGYYVLMSNIFSSGRNYPAAAVMRQAAKKKKLAKTPGCTLIEINDKPYTFTSGDRSHPRTTEIYAKLDELATRMAAAGYRSETQAALCDVEEEDKENMVKVHSEKLAIAFGLISSIDGDEITIIKNLRVCLDCHNATKYISKVTGRSIVVRDANRFHHFSEGVCSCRDYW